MIGMERETGEGWDGWGRLRSGEKPCIFFFSVRHVSTQPGGAAYVFRILPSFGLTFKTVYCAYIIKRDGACILLEQKMNKEMLWLACRHHIMEIILESVVQNEIGPSSGPDNLFLKRFQKNWQLINKEESIRR